MMPAPVQTPDGTEYTAPASAPTAECSHIDVRAEAGGFTATCYYKPKTDRGPQDRTSAAVKPEGHAFKTFDDLVAYLQQTLGAAPDQAQPDASGASGDDDGDEGNA